MSNANALWQKLYTAKLVNQAQAPDNELNSIFANLLQGFSAWLAALFLAIGCVTSSLFTNADSIHTFLMVWAVVFFVVSFAIFRLKQPAALFLEQTGLALSLCAQGFLLAGIIIYLDKDYDLFAQEAIHLICLIACAMYLGLFFLFNNRWHRVGCIIGLNLALLVFLDFNYLNLLPLAYLGVVAILLSCQYRTLTLHTLSHPLLYGLMASIAINIFIQSVLHQFWYEIFYHYYSAHISMPYAEWIFLSAMQLFTVSRLLKKSWPVKPPLLGIYVTLSLTLIVVQYFIPALGIFSMLMVLGYYYASPIIKWTGLVGAVLYVGWFYYDLSWTLLDKSLMLMLMGAVLLISGLLLSRFSKELTNA